VQGTDIHHYLPFTRHMTVSVPGGQERKWEPDEINRAVNTIVYGSRHGGLSAGAEFQGAALRQRPRPRT
jgi:hypothetical protein